MVGLSAPIIGVRILVILLVANSVKSIDLFNLEPNTQDIYGLCRGIYTWTIGSLNGGTYNNDPGIWSAPSYSALSSTSGMLGLSRTTHAALIDHM